MGHTSQGPKSGFLSGGEKLINDPGGFANKNDFFLGPKPFILGTLKRSF